MIDPILITLEKISRTLETISNKLDVLVKKSKHKETPSKPSLDEVMIINDYDISKPVTTWPRVDPITFEPITPDPKDLGPDVKKSKELDMEERAKKFTHTPRGIGDGVKKSKPPVMTVEGREVCDKCYTIIESCDCSPKNVKKPKLIPLHVVGKETTDDQIPEVLKTPPTTYSGDAEKSKAEDISLGGCFSSQEAKRRLKVYNDAKKSNADGYPSESIKKHWMGEKVWYPEKSKPPLCGWCGNDAYGHDIKHCAEIYGTHSSDWMD